MQRVSVESSNIKSIGHDQKELLHVEFHQGIVYEYKPVKYETYLEMLAAESVGKYFNEHIKKDKNIVFNKLDKNK